MERLLWALVGILCIAGGGCILYFFPLDSLATNEGSGMSMAVFAGPGLVFAGAACMMCAFFDPLRTKVTSGIVTGYDFIPAHTFYKSWSAGALGLFGMPAMVPSECHVPDLWALEIEDGLGRHSQVYFRSDPAEQYPIASYYSGNKR